MKAQVIEDQNGVPTGVFIPIKEWEKLKKQYPNIAEETRMFELSEEQKKILDAQEGLPISEYQDIIFYQIDETNKFILVKAVFNTSQDIGKRPK